MMRKTLTLLSLSLGITLVNPLWSALAQVTIPSPYLRVPSPPQTQTALKLADLGVNCSPTHACLGWDDQIWGGIGQQGDKQALLTAIDYSLSYLTKDEAIAAYKNYPVREITPDRVRRSLVRFRELVISSQSPEQLQAAVRREFAFYQSIGNDGKGTVKFTAYYEPVYTASRVRTSVYKYPLYQLPSNFKQWTKPHPKRIDLEGKDGLLGAKSPLNGLELLWFRDRLDAYMVHIQGSAQIKLTDGRTTSIGYAGGTDYPWTSIGKELAKDQKLARNQLTLPRVVQFFRQNPQELSNYLPRWQRFVFFKETGTVAQGSIHVPVTDERSIATDKSLMPPGALALIHTSLPYATGSGRLQYRTVSRFVLDQDTGSAIKGGTGRLFYGDWKISR